jgi:hypothetical protein
MRGGGDYMAVSVKLRNLARESKRGFTRVQIEELSGLGTWDIDRIIAGIIVRPEKLRAYAEATGGDPDKFVAAALETNQLRDPLKALANVCADELRLPAEDCRDIVLLAKKKLNALEEQSRETAA